MAGLDFGKPVRWVNLEVLPDNDKQFLVKQCEIEDDLIKLSPKVPSALSICIALPDRQLLNKFIINKENHENILWDQRDDKKVVFPKEKANVLLDSLHQHAFSVRAIDIESEAIARALRLVCQINDPYFAVLYIDRETVWISIFENLTKIFFHQEKLLENNQDIIIDRGLKLFKQQFPEIKIEAYYVVGESADKIEKWGKILNITQYLHFESDVYRQLFKTQNTQWLLACGLSLWNKNSSWNLLPWRDQKKQEEKKDLFKYSLKIILCSCIIIAFLHGLLLFARLWQDKHNNRLDKKIAELNMQAQTVNQIQQKINLVQSQIKMVEKTSVGLSPSQLLEKLSETIPDGIFLNSLNLNDKQITLTGRAETEIKVKDFLSRLKQNTIFAKPNLKNLIQVSAAQPYYFNFKIEMELI